MTGEYTRRYQLYCKAHGNDGEPERQLKEDSEKYPGGKMCGFILWIDAKWYDFGMEKKVKREYRTLYQEEFDAWLEKNYRQKGNQDQQDQETDRRGLSRHRRAHYTGGS